MTFSEALFQIPIMFYATLILLPVAITAYFLAGKKKRALPLRSVDPARILGSGGGVNVKREVAVNLLLGAVLGLGLSLIIFIGAIGADWYNSTGLFAVILPRDTYPPKISDVFPPHPPSYAPISTDSGKSPSPN